MLRRALLAAITVGLLLPATMDSASAYRKPTGVATLSAAYIVFHVRDDDKDHDSTESVTVLAGDHTVGSVGSAGSGAEWHDQSDIQPVYLDNIDPNIEPSDCDKLHVIVHHSTNGNDDFHFSFSVILRFTDGSVYTYEQPRQANLSKNNGVGAWDLTRAGG